MEAGQEAGLGARVAAAVGLTWWQGSLHNGGSRGAGSSWHSRRGEKLDSQQPPAHPPAAKAIGTKACPTGACCRQQQLQLHRRHQRRVVSFASLHLILGGWLAGALSTCPSNEDEPGTPAGSPD